MAENSILTETQREFLQMDEEKRKEEYSKQQRHYHRSSIQSRVLRGFGDMPLLDEYADPEEIIEGADLRKLREGLEATARLVYQVALVAGHDPEDLIDDAIRDLQHGRADEVWEALEQGEIRADFEEIEVLRNGGRIPEEAHAAAFRKRIGKPEGLTLEDIVEAWREGREASDIGESFFSADPEE
jgi:hypothetical protein